MMSLSRFLPILAVLMLLCSCHKDDSPAPPQAALVIKIMDATDHYDAIFLNIKKIWTRTSTGSGAIDINGRPFNITAIEKDTILAHGDVPTGLVQEIILEWADEGNELLTNGTLHKLKIIDGKYVTLKIDKNTLLSAQQTNNILLHFDILKSIERTQNGDFLLKPVIEAVLKTTP
jgi:hypothetical protein